MFMLHLHHFDHQYVVFRLLDSEWFCKAIGLIDSEFQKVALFLPSPQYFVYFCSINQSSSNKAKSMHLWTTNSSGFSVWINFIFKVFFFLQQLGCKWFIDSLTCQNPLCCHYNVTCTKSLWKTQNAQSTNTDKRNDTNSEKSQCGVD